MINQKRIDSMSGKKDMLKVDTTGYDGTSNREAAKKDAAKIEKYAQELRAERSKSVVKKTAA